MKVIFLDIDGCLNCSNDFKNKKTAKVLNKDMLARLFRIVEATDAKIVLSSTWRKYKSFVNHLKYKGKIKFIGMTPDFENAYHENLRGVEIKHWLDKYDHITHYVIIDDDWDFLEEQRPFVVLTGWEMGLQDCDVDKAIKILNGKEHNK